MNDRYQQDEKTKVNTEKNKQNPYTCTAFVLQNQLFFNLFDFTLLVYSFKKTVFLA